MTESQRLELIANAVSKTTKKVAPQFEDLLADLLSEKLVVEHGLVEAKQEDIEEEFVSLDAVDSDKDDENFDEDENLVDMDCVSESMRSVFDS
jgi:hypothetical protein